MSLYDELSGVTLDSSGHSLLIETPSSVQTHSFNAQAPLERRLISPLFMGRKMKSRAMDHHAREAGAQCLCQI